MNASQSPAFGKFRPTSLDDFKTYASNLSWLIDIPKARGQELLARIYGYADLHELQAVMKRPGKAGFEKKHDFSWMAETGNRTLECVMKELDLPNLRELSKRGWKSRDCGLFEAPGDHRSMFRRVKKMIQVIDPVVGEVHAVDVHEYAILREYDEKSVYLEFTELGLSVYDALREVTPDDHAGREAINEGLSDIYDLMERYPTNPWVKAAYVCSFSRYFFQGDWAQNLRMKRRPEHGYADLDADPGFKANAAKYAPQFLEAAKESIALFDELLEGKGASHVSHKLQVPGGESFYYPAILYFAAYTAANFGDEKLATQLAERNKKIVEHDNFGSRYLLSVLYLNSGRAASTIEKLTSADSKDGWMTMCEAAAYAAAGNMEKTISKLSMALESCWAPVEIFSGEWKQARNTALVGSNHDTPAWFQELFFRSSFFWVRELKVTKFFTAVCNDKHVRAAVLEHHAARQGTWGSGFLPPAESMARQAEADLQKIELKKVLKSRLPELWAENI